MAIAHFKAFSTPETRAGISDPCDEQTFRASKLDWANIDRSPTSLKFRGLTAQLLRIRREKIVPLIKAGIVSAERSLLGDNLRMGGLNVRWRTGGGDMLQIVANFAEQELPMPRLIDGEALWQLRPGNAGVLLPSDIIVRLGRES